MFFSDFEHFHGGGIWTEKNESMFMKMLLRHM